MQENWYDWAVRTKDYLHNATLSPRQFDAEKTDHVFGALFHWQLK